MDLVLALAALAALVALYAWGWRRVVALLRARGRGALVSNIAGALAGCVPAFVGLLCVGALGAAAMPMTDRAVALALCGAVIAGLWASTRPRPRAAVAELREAAPAVPRGALSSPTVPTRTAAAAPVAAPKLPALFRFDYVDAHGEITPREVRVETVGTSGATRYVEGHCKTSQARRTFRLEGIMGELTHVSSGNRFGRETFFKAPESAAPLASNPAAFRRNASTGARGKQWQTAVFFAGFGPSKYAELADLADLAGWDVRARITRTVDYVVIGSMTGSNQLADAESLGIKIIDEQEYKILI